MANAVLLHHQLVREPLYHVILLFEFLQMMFLVYYPLDFGNAFTQQSIHDLNIDLLVPKILSHYLNSKPGDYQRIRDIIAPYQEEEPLTNTFRMDA